MSLETYLSKGNIHLGSGTDCLFSAAFVPVSRNETKQVLVSSDRGTLHLLGLLEAELLEDKSIKDKADLDYPYPKTMFSITDLDRFLQNAFIEIAETKDGIIATAYHSSIPCLKAIPGMYERTGMGSTIVEAMNALISVPIKEWRRIEFIRPQNQENQKRVLIYP